MPDSVQSLLYSLLIYSLQRTSDRGNCYDLHFADEETEAQMDEFPWPESRNQKVHAGKLGLGCRQPGPHKHVVISTAEPAQRGHGGPGRSDTCPGDGRLKTGPGTLTREERPHPCPLLELPPPEVSHRAFPVSARRSSSETCDSLLQADGAGGRHAASLGSLLISSQWRCGGITGSWATCSHSFLPAPIHPLHGSASPPRRLRMVHAWLYQGLPTRKW